jgi:hypothetical protein
MAAATRKSTKATETSGFSFANVAPVAVEELPKGTRDTAPNPLEETIKASADQGPKAIEVPDGEKAHDAERFIRRAVAQNGLSMRLRYTDAEGNALTPAQAHEHTETVWVYFNILSEKKDRAYAPRKYNNEDIRKWAQLETGAKITKEIRNAYRAEHGYDVRDR